MNTQTIQTKEKEEIISLLCSDDVDDKVLACIIMGRMGREFCQDICNKKEEYAAFIYFEFRFDKSCLAAQFKGNVIHTHGYILIGSHAINYFPNQLPWNWDNIIYDAREE